MMAALDREKFAKVLAKAESSHDAEALTAVRMAAKMARAAGLTLGQAVEGRQHPTELTTRLADATIRIAALEKEIRALRRKSDETNPEMWGRGFVAGKEQGYNEAFAPMERERSGFRRQIEALEVELEPYRPALDWPTLARAFADEGRRWGSAKAKAIAARARRNALTVEDKITLRHFAGGPAHE